MNTKQTVEHKSEIRNGAKRGAFALLALAIQVAWLYLQLVKLSDIFPGIPIVINVLGVLIVLGIYGRHMNASAKMPWIMLISAFPFLGVPLYFMTGNYGCTEKMRLRYQAIDEVLMPLLPQDEAAFRELEEKDLRAANQFRYVKDYAGYPVYHNTDVKFYPTAEEGFEAQLSELAKAEKFIFMEYHAIEQASSFERLHKVLKDRAAAGVEVRLFYDDVGSLGFIDMDFITRMTADGIRCRVFNPVLPILKVFMNNRDHRKITVIDGKVGFTGGYNLADEYFNITHPFGHWFDTGLRLEGDAVRSLTAIFLENWNAIRGDDKDDTEHAKYMELHPYTAAEPGWCQPYADSPLDEEHTGENVYMNVLNSAEKYAWFVTPYLIITDEMAKALTLAARRGVDVRIVTPGIPDKKLIYSATRSYYSRLARCGVRIFEYTPGFCHAKQCVSDDRTATCGTINMDYRSLYLHFENGVLLSHCRAVADIRQSFEEMFPQCREVTEQYRHISSTGLRIGYCLLRLVAPLL